MFYAITANDTLFFRSSVPFEEEGDTYTISSAFPPMPSVYAGALRPFLREPQRNEPKPRIKIGFNGVSISGDICFPMPLDGVWDPCLKTFAALLLRKNKASSFPLAYCLCAGDQQKGKIPLLKGGGYINKASMEAYLRGDVTKTTCFALGDHYVYDPKVGVRINKKTGAVEQGCLYEVRQVRLLPDLSLVVQADGVDIADHTYIRLGGESRTATIAALPGEGELRMTRIRAEKERIFKLYFATPALFRQGWLPGWIDPDSKIGTFSYKKKRVRVKLVSAAVGRYVGVGGFAAVKPTELRFAVPAGSVYYFKLLGDSTWDDAVALFHQKCLSEYRAGGDKEGKWGFERPQVVFDRLRYCDRGFGYALVGQICEGQGVII